MGAGEKLMRTPSPGRRQLALHWIAPNVSPSPIWSASGALHVTLCCILLLAAGAAFAQDNSLAIENEFLQARFDRATGRFSLTAKPSQHVFLRDGRFSNPGGAAKITNVADTRFGTAQAIELETPGGNRDALLLFPKLPFALFRSSMHNGGTDVIVTNNFRPLSAMVDLGKPAADLKTLGTGGLLTAGKNPGSYVWLAVAEPITRRGVVSGWLTHDRGSGIVFSSEEGDRVRLDGQIDYGWLRIAPGRTEELETLAIGYFDDARLGLEKWADTVAKVYEIQLPAQPAGYCTWYSRPYGGASDEKHLAELSTFSAKQLAPFGFSVVQIDDHWQAGISTNGPHRNFSTHAPNGPYPAGMKSAADQIKSLGLVPGLWFMPFAGTYYDPFFREHQDWFVKDAHSAPYETKWGGTCLDMTHPGARDYLRSNIRRIASEWGYQYFKMDGLWTGTATRQVYVNSGYRDDGIGDAVLHDPEKTNIEAYRDGLKLVREAAGKSVFLLGCCSPQNMRSYGGAFGLVDAMRIGPDNGAGWSSLLRGPTFGSRHYFLHGRVWYNDPDPIYVRTNVPLQQAQAICSWVTLSGQLNLSSEWLPGLPPERLDLLKRTMPGHGLLPRPADLFEEPVPRIWLLTDERRPPRRDVIGLFNWSDQPSTFDTALEHIGLARNTVYVAFDYWANTLLEAVTNRLQTELPPRSCRIVAVRPRLDRPQLISTSRHLTQGMVDVLEENWNESKSVLSGRSKVVADDPYELRIVLPSGKSNWQMDSVRIANEDRDAGVRSDFKADTTLVRATIRSPANREVTWTIHFKASSHPHR